MFAFIVANIYISRVISTGKMKGHLICAISLCHKAQIPKNV